MPYGDLLEAYWPWLAGGSGVLTVLLLAASLVGLPWVLRGLPDDILHNPPPPPPLGQRVVLNLVGYTLIVLGILMLLLPGQGLLTLLAGALIADVPGKRRWVVWVLQRGPVRRGVDAIRARGDVGPLR